jgi:hypothetical protein
MSQSNYFPGLGMPPAAIAYAIAWSAIEPHGKRNGFVLHVTDGWVDIALKLIPYAVDAVLKERTDAAPNYSITDARVHILRIHDGKPVSLKTVIEQGAPADVGAHTIP